MAEINTVPLGQAGTGAAFRLGESQAANRFIQNVQSNREIERRNQLLAQQQAQQIAQDWQKNALKIESGQYWQPEFNARMQEHLKKGIELRGMGINPYNYDATNPQQRQIAEDYLLERQGITADQGARKLREASIAKQYQALKANPDQFDPESIQEFQNYVNKPFSEANQMEVPQLRAAFNPMKEIVPKLDPVTFQTSKVVGNTRVQENKLLKEPTLRNIESLFKASQGGERFIQRETGLTPDEAKQIPNTLEENKKELIKEYRGNPRVREEFAREFGITGESQELDDLLNQQAEQNFANKQKYNAVMNEYLGLAQAKANEFLKTNPDFSLEREADRRQGVSQRNTRFAERKSGGSGENTNIGAPQDILIPLSDVKGSNIPASNYIGVSIPKKNFVGTQGVISLTDGKPVPPLSSSNDYEIVGVGNFPIVNKVLTAGGKDIARGSLAQENFAKNNPDAVDQKPFVHVQVPNKYGTMKDYLVPLARLPENVRNSKSVREALAGFQPASTTSKTQTNQTKPVTASKTVPLSKVKSLVGRPGYEGYTEKELVDYYKSQGYTIK